MYRTRIGQRLGSLLRRWPAYMPGTPQPIPAIEAVDTDTAAFLGEAERGPSAPQLVTDFAGFEARYGGYERFGAAGPLAGSYLPHAVDGFFRNGGRRCYVGRVCAEDSAASVELADSAEGTVLEVEAIGPGAWGCRIGVRVDATGLAQGSEYRLTVRYWHEADAVPGTTAGDLGAGDGSAPPTVEEVHDRLSPAPGAPNYDVDVLARASRLVELTRRGTGRPADTVGLVRLAGVPSTDGEVEVDDYRGTTSGGRRTGLAALQELDDVAIVVVPDQARAGANHTALTDLIVDHCEAAGDRFAVLGCPRTTDYGSTSVPRETASAAYYTPWVEVTERGIPGTMTVPPCGHVAGFYARTDTTRGVHVAPANEPLRGVVGLARAVSSADQAALTAAQINPIREFPSREIRVWGARTASLDPERRYVHVQRLLLMLEASLEAGLEQIGDGPNEPALWERVSRAVESFLAGQWRAGALQGATPSEAYFARCDRSTMTQADIDAGRLVLEVGVAPTRQAEFVVLRLVYPTAGPP